jgi:hypothetical protein
MTNIRRYEVPRPGCAGGVTWHPMMPIKIVGERAALALQGLELIS